MRILVLSHMYPSIFNNVAGIFVHEQVKALIARGVEVKVISPVPWSPFPIKHLSRKWKLYSKIPQRAVWDGVQVWYPRYVVFPRAYFFASSGKRMYYGIRKVVESIHREFSFDLIHAHVALPDGFAGMLLAQKYEKPLVVTIHGQDLQNTVIRSSKCKKALRNVLFKANAVIVVSRKLLKLAKEQFGIDNITVINNGVCVEKILSSKKSKFWEGKKIILSVSNLIRTKGIDLNIKAMWHLIKKHPNLYYVVVGDGPFKNSLIELVSSLSLEKNVEFVGQLSHERVMEYMSACDIFSLPSWQEGFGIVYIEAMAYGKPIIACRGEGPEDFVKHGETGLLVKPRDVDSLVEALDFLLTHPEKAKAMGEQARRLILENFTWKKNAEKTIAVYEKVFHGR